MKKAMSIAAVALFVMAIAGCCCPKSGSCPAKGDCPAGCTKPCCADTTK